MCLASAVLHINSDELRYSTFGLVKEELSMKFIKLMLVAFLVNTWSLIAYADAAPPCEKVVSVIGAGFPKDSKQITAYKPTCEGRYGKKQTLVYAYKQKSNDTPLYSTEERREEYARMMGKIFSSSSCDAAEFKELLKYFNVKFVMMFDTTDKKYLATTIDAETCKAVQKQGVDMGAKLTTELCPFTANQLNKKMPQKVDEITIRQSVECRNGFSKEVALKFNDEVISDKSPQEWRSALQKNMDVIQSLKNQYCSTASLKTFLKMADLVIVYKVRGEQVAEIILLESDCAN